MENTYKFNLTIFIIFLLIMPGVIISEENSQLLIEDAKNAGLNVACFSDISMLDVFPKNN